MDYRDVLIMRNNLEKVNTIEGTNPRFTYAVSRNKARLDSIIKILDAMKKPSPEIEKYWNKVDEINKKFALTDESGTVQYTTIELDGMPKKAYAKVIGEGNPESKYTKEIDKLKEEFKQEIEMYEKQVRDYNQMLTAEVPDDDYRRFMIDFDIVPAGLSAKAMDGCLPFIKEIDQDKEPVKEENKSKLKKT